MKKLLAGLLVLAVAGSAFAQVDVTPYGTVDVDFGVEMDLGDDTDDSSSTAWNFGLNNAIIGVKASAGNLSGKVQLQAASGTARLDALDAAVNFDPVVLSVGWQWLPWVQWSALDWYGDNNWGFGASAVRSAYIQAKYAKDDVSVYCGLLEADVAGEAMKDNATFPGFYLGGDYKTDAFSIGGAFYGVPRGKEYSYSIGMGAPSSRDETSFAWMGNLHAKFAAGPASIGVNVALYGDPVVSGLQNAIAMNSDYYGHADRAMILEGCLSIGVAELGPGDLGITVGFLTDMAEKLSDDQKTGSETSGVMDMRLGLCYAVELGGGFSFIPGLAFNLPLSGVDGEDRKDKGALSVGVTLGYSF